MEFGRRLLPQVVDFYARTDPAKVYASIPKSSAKLSNGFNDITMAKLAAVVNRLSWWMDDDLGYGDLDTVAYIGPTDIRYAAMFLAAVKCGYKMLFLSLKNQLPQSEGMLLRSKCRAVFYAHDIASAVEGLRQSSRLQEIVFRPVASVNELLETSGNKKVYPYEKSFQDAENEPCLILHSSGSTGDPKLITMTHGTFSCTDNDRNMPVPDGRSAQNAAQFNFQQGGKFYSCFPPYHLAGVHAYIDIPIFSSSASVVFGPTDLPPSGYLLSEILRQQKVRALYLPPFIIEQWSAEPSVIEQAKDLDFVLYGGGPLSTAIGDKLSEVTNVCQMYGSVEVGQVQLLVPQSGEWSYMELNPFEEADMQPNGDGTFEMVLHQEQKHSAHRSLWHNFPAIKEWRTGDLFVPHPTKNGLWRFHARVDDLIVLSSSFKLRPLEMETLIQGHPLISAALIAGQGKSEPLLIVEPKLNAFEQGDTPEDFIDCIWPAVEEGNSIAPVYAKIRRSKVLVADPKKPFMRAPKGTVVRRLTIQAYAAEIEAAYSENLSNDAKLCEKSTRGVLSSFIMPGLKQFVRKHVGDHLTEASFGDNENLFSKGLDSLGAAALSRGLQKDLASHKGLQNGSRTAASLRLIYTNPTVEKLAHVIFQIITDREAPPHIIVRDTKEMERALTQFTQALPEAREWPASRRTVESQPINVALLGPRGSLGPNILRELMKDPMVGKIYCLNRGDDGRERLRATFQSRNLPCDVDDERLTFMPIDLAKPKLGLSPGHLHTILSEAHIIVHNAWRVDFSWTLDSYKTAYLRSIREIVDISSDSFWGLRLVFVSSISSVQEWASVFSTPVTEASLESYDVASPLGYGQSKHVAERILSRASAASNIPVTILRLGQVAGSTNTCLRGGGWSTDEWIPSLAAISKELRLVPDDIPPIDWVPVNLAARAIVELASAECFDVEMKRASSDQVSHKLQIFNVVNPTLSEWSTFAKALQRRLTADGGSCRQTHLSEWVDIVVQADMGTELGTSSNKIIPFFQYLAETASRGIVLQPKFDTSTAVRTSKTMREMRKVDEGLIDQWLGQLGI